MRKYIGVMVCFVFLAIVLLPDAYSVWQKDLEIRGSVQITKEKQNKGKKKDGAGEPEGLEQVLEELESNYPVESEPEEAEETEEIREECSE